MIDRGVGIVPIENNHETGPGSASLPAAKNHMFIKLIISIGLTILIGYIIYREVPDWRQSLSVMVRGRPLMILAGLVLVAFEHSWGSSIMLAVI